MRLAGAATVSSGAILLAFDQSRYRQPRYRDGEERRFLLLHLSCGPVGTDKFAPSAYAVSGGVETLKQIEIGP